MKANTRDGQRRIASELAHKLGKHSISTRQMRKLQCQVLIHALLNGKHVEQTNGDLKVRL